MDTSSGSIIKKMKEDFELLTSGDVIHKKGQKLCKVNEEIVSETVSSILHKDHIVSTPWVRENLIRATLKNTTINALL